MSLLKALCYAYLIIVAAVYLSACASSAKEPLPERDAATVYYNDYLGLSISVPSSWQVDTLSANLSTTQGEAGAPILLAYADGSSRMELINMQNSANSSDAEHSRFCAYGELFPEPVDIEEYLGLLINLVEADNGGYTYTLLKREQVELSRHIAERICLEVSTGTENNYREEYYILGLEQGVLVFYLNYWPQNKASQEAAFSVLESVSLQ